MGLGFGVWGLGLGIRVHGLATGWRCVELEPSILEHGLGLGVSGLEGVEAKKLRASVTLGFGGKGCRGLRVSGFRV